MKRILLIYHFFYPDTVISARIFSDLAQYLAKNGSDVTVFTGNYCIRSSEVLCEKEEFEGVKILRFSRPGFSQKGYIGRLVNSFILQIKWILGFRKRRNDFDAIILGTDPQFGYLMLPFFRLINRKIRLIHWAFDLYPEAVLVNSAKWMSIPGALLKLFTGFSYSFVDDMVDISPCMREKLLKYNHKACCHTLPPWALVEPVAVSESNKKMRQELFGDAKIALLYSGTVGHAHDLQPFIELARKCRREGIDAAFCFAGYGNCYQAQTSKITSEDTNIRLAGFASEEDLEKRLLAADIHLVSVRPGWEGVVVPSKFFGSLAAGRPILFSGSKSCEIARWCDRFRIGYFLQEDTCEVLNRLTRNRTDLTEMMQRAFQCYHETFSKQTILEKWHAMLHAERGIGDD